MSIDCNKRNVFLFFSLWKWTNDCKKRVWDDFSYESPQNRLRVSFSSEISFETLTLSWSVIFRKNVVAKFKRTKASNQSYIIQELGGFQSIFYRFGRIASSSVSINSLVVIILGLLKPIWPIFFLQKCQVAKFLVKSMH